MQASEPPPGLSFSASPLLPQRVAPQAPGPEAVPDSPPPRRRRRGSLVLLLLGVAVGAGIWSWNQQRLLKSPTSQIAAFRTAVVTTGPLVQDLRVGGTIQALNSSSIRAPRMRGPRDAGRQQLTLMELAKPGSVVSAGATIAKFELKWLEDHISDVSSTLTQSKAEVDKRRAEIMIERETDRQATVAAKAEYDKAMLDLRTAEVKSEIEAEVLKNLALQAEAAWKEVAEEAELKEVVHNADIAVLENQVATDRLHVERHQRDYDRLNVTTPAPGLIVMETVYRGGGQFSQTEEGDQVYPGSLFMRVVDLSNMVLSASVNQVDIQSVRMGQEATVRLDAYPGLVLPGRVVGIGAIASPGDGSSRFRRGSGMFVKSVEVQVSIEGSDERVIPDLSASADILLDEPKEGLLVPRGALRTGPDGGAYVFVQSGEGFTQQDVKVGDRNATHALIEAGLSGGEQVLLGDEFPAA